MLSGAWVSVVGLIGSFAIATVSSPAGVSGAVLLLPFQVSVLGTPSPAVTPTNLLYNVVATPGALYRYWRQGQFGRGRLAGLLIAGTLPGVIVGSAVRVELVPGERGFDGVIALVLVPLGAWLFFGRATPAALETGGRAHSDRWVVLLSLVVGGVGGVYGIGGGAILAPVLIASRRPSTEVAPATLAATLITSIAGVATFLVLSTRHGGSVAPDWGIGLVLGLGGLAGSYVGARLQPRLPETGIRRALGLLVLAIGARYAWLAAS